ncbi:MAG: hypothetical protein KDD51_17165, partial [Bdellovibrionales bacterium]|nr:hypothetical protein [Bdellovibrionales bacterium]
MKLLTIIFFFLSPWLYAGPKVVTLKTRPKVSLSFLLDQPAQLRKGTLLLFVGGEGDGAFKYKNGKVALGQNFLARILPYLVEHGYAAVLLGIPSDLPSGYTDKFRTSTEHLNDIAMVVEYLKKRDLTPIHLVGTSRGALSATFAASALEPLYVKSLVLTGAVTGPLEGPLPARVQQGTLIVHPLEDPCPTAPYNEAAGLRKNFTS